MADSTNLLENANSPIDGSRPGILPPDQVAQGVATNLMKEVNAVMSGPYTGDSHGAKLDLDLEVYHAATDPQGPAIFKAMAQMVDNHDPIMGTLQGSVERDKDGNVTGLTFENQDREAAATKSINTFLAAGNTYETATEELPEAKPGIQRGDLQISTAVPKAL